MGAVIVNKGSVVGQGFHRYADVKHADVYGEQVANALAQRGFNLNSPENFVLTTAALSNLIGNSAAVMLLLKRRGRVWSQRESSVALRAD